jgi:hypothetical protein
VEGCLPTLKKESPDGSCSNSERGYLPHGTRRENASTGILTRSFSVFQGGFVGPKAFRDSEFLLTNDCQRRIIVRNHLSGSLPDTTLDPE